MTRKRFEKHNRGKSVRASNQAKKKRAAIRRNEEIGWAKRSGPVVVKKLNPETGEYEVQEG